MTNPWQRHVKIGDCDLYLGDCLAVMPALGKVDAVVTSPPYDNLRDYGEGFDGVDCFGVLTNISNILINGGVCMWNVADATIKGSESGSSFRQALHAIDCGLNLHDTMIYQKPQAFGGSSKAYLHSFEYMFVFSKGVPKTFNAIRDRKNVRDGISSTTKGGRKKNGQLQERTTVEVSPYGKRKNVWAFGVGGVNHGHPAIMPDSMARDHIISWSNESETILDPFMGSGTTLVACAKLGRKGIGIELDPDYFEIAVERVKKAYEQPDLFVPAPKQVLKQGGLFDE